MTNISRNEIKSLTGGKFALTRGKIERRYNGELLTFV